MHSHMSHAHVTHMSFYGPAGVHLASRSLCMTAVVFSDCPWQGRTRSQRHTRGPHPSKRELRAPHYMSYPSWAAVGSSQPAALGDLESEDIPGAQAGESRAKGQCILKGAPRSMDTVQGVNLGSGTIGVRQVAVGCRHGDGGVGGRSWTSPSAWRSVQPVRTNGGGGPTRVQTWWWRVKLRVS